MAERDEKLGDVSREIETARKGILPVMLGGAILVIVWPEAPVVKVAV